MVNIYYVLNSRFPTIKAYGLQVAKTCEGLKNAGASVRLVVPIRARHRELRGLDALSVYGIRNRFRLIRLLSFDFTRLHLNGRVWFLIQQIVFALMTAVAVSLKKGVVYSRDPFTLYLLSYVRRGIFWEVHRMPENPRTAVYRRLLRHCDGIVCITEGIQKAFLSLGVPASRLMVSPDGIDIDEFEITQSQDEAQRELGFDSAKHQVVYIGQLLEWKGVETLIGAAQLLDDRFRTTIVGGTAEDSARLRALDSSGKIRFESFQPHNRMPLWLRAADTVVLPNKKDAGVSEYYTSPLKMFEYMAAGKSIVASDLSSIREVLNENNAILVMPDDPAALAKGILDSMEDIVGVSARVRHARQDVEQYTWKKRGEGIMSFIEHAISH